MTRIDREIWNSYNTRRLRVLFKRRSPPGSSGKHRVEQGDQPYGPFSGGPANSIRRHSRNRNRPLLITLSSVIKGGVGGARHSFTITQHNTKSKHPEVLTSRFYPLYPTSKTSPPSSSLRLSAHSPPVFTSIANRRLARVDPITAPFDKREAQPSPPI